MKNFRTYNTAVEFYRLATALELKNPLKAQLSKASLSIVLNLAEGRGKPTLDDQLRFFHIAMGSTRECQAILDLAQLKDSQAWVSLDNVAAHLYRLIESAK